MPASRPIVAVWPDAAFAPRGRLFASLADAFGVEVCAWSARRGVPAAVLALGEDAPEEALRAGAAVFAAPVGADGASPVRVDVLEDAPVDRRLHGAELAGELAAPLGAPDGGEEVVARAASAVVWTRARGDALRHRVAAPLAELPAGVVLRDALLYERPVALVAVVAFLRELTAGDGWQRPALRASIVFDDPNLRWRTYGYIDYRRLLQHADEHGYHAAMAMIPLDAARPHRGAAALFARRPDRLSLVIHGNDHVRRELMGAADAGAAMATAAQAIRRMAQFERRSGLRVDRVMMPPHGLASARMARALGAVGFEALSAIHPLPWTERPPADGLLTGWRPAQFVAGCAVLPRFPLDCAPTEIGLRAFLDQPLVFYGHHDDLVGGLEPLERAAAVARRLGDVEWTSVGRIVRSNYDLRVRGDEASLRLHSRRVAATVPPGVRALAVEPPSDAVEPGLLTGWSVGDGAVVPFGRDVRVTPGEPVDVRLHSRVDIDAVGIAAPAWRPWPRLRRLAAEARDRVQPLYSAGSV